RGVGHGTRDRRGGGRRCAWWWARRWRARRVLARRCRGRGLLRSGPRNERDAARRVLWHAGAGRQRYLRRAVKRREPAGHASRGHGAASRTVPTERPAEAAAAQRGTGGLAELRHEPARGLAGLCRRSLRRPL